MHFFPKLSLQAGIAFALAQAASASIVIFISATRVDTENNSAVASGTLFQLVNLGANGVFDEINVNDGTTTGLGRWTSADDTVIDAAFVTTVDGSTYSDFASTKAFDLSPSSLTESSTGKLNRNFQFDLGAIPAGAKIGIRWFSGLQASNFDSITLQAGQHYGQFTRQSGIRIDGDSAWIFPAADGTNVIFDPMVTADGSAAANPDPASAGDASFTVVPEPAVIGLSLIGAAGMALLRRRRA